MAAEQTTQAFILHRQDYQEHSLILYALTPEYAKINLIAQSLHTKKRGAWRQLLQPFQLLTIRYRQKPGQLQNLLDVDIVTPKLLLKGKTLYSAFYLNELIYRLWPQEASNNQLFDLYRLTLQALIEEQDIEPILRQFEFHFLGIIGYQINFSHTCNTNEMIISSQYYHYIPGYGFELATPKHTITFLGQHITAIQQGQWQQPQILKQAKYLIRLTLDFLLAGKPLRSREFFISLSSKNN